MTAYPTMPVDPTSVVGRRIGAWTVDLLIYLGLSFGILFATGGVAWQSKTFDDASTAKAACTSYKVDTPQHVCAVADTTVTFVNIKGSTNGVLPLHFLAYCLVQGILGGSLGKLAFGLRVVDQNGNLAGIGKSFLRTMLWVVDAITCGLPIVGGVMIVSTKGHRRVGDMVASTFVVDKGNVGTPIAPWVIGASAPVPGAGWPPPAGDQGWAPPAAPMVPPATPTDGPIWDEGRNTYIQFDRSRDCWVQWVTAASEWRPLDQ